MYAVIETGGRQYRVEPGDVLEVEHSQETSAEKIEFERVLLVAGDDGVKVGAPVVEGARVTGVRVADVRGPKLLVFKKKRRKGYQRLRGHRQDLCRIRIEAIEG